MLQTTEGMPKVASAGQRSRTPIDGFGNHWTAIVLARHVGGARVRGFTSRDKRTGDFAPRPSATVRLYLLIPVRKLHR